MGNKSPSQVVRRADKGRLHRHWRDAVFLKGEFECAKCGSKENLTADHIKPIVSHPELVFNVDNGQVLCEPCRIKDMLRQRKNGELRPKR